MEPASTSYSLEDIEPIVARAALQWDLVAAASEPEGVPSGRRGTTIASEGTTSQNADGYSTPNVSARATTWCAEELMITPPALRRAPSVKRVAVNRSPGKTWDIAMAQGLPANWDKEESRRADSNRFTLLISSVRSAVAGRCRVLQFRYF